MHIGTLSDIKSVTPPDGVVTLTLRRFKRKSSKKAIFLCCPQIPLSARRTSERNAVIDVPPGAFDVSPY
jgi:hypothetical protein